MNNLYHKPDVNEILARLEKLTPNAKRQWGKMDVAQMLAHLNAFIEVALDISFPKPMFSGRIIGRFFKSRYVSKKRFSKNSPTGKNFIIDGQEDFEKERTKAIALIQKFYDNGPEKCTRQPHQFFGKLSPDEWAIVQWKHFDHHLRQFDV